MLGHGPLVFQCFKMARHASPLFVGRAWLGNRFQLLFKTPYQWKQLKSRGNTAQPNQRKICLIIEHTIENVGKPCPPLQIKWVARGKI